MCKEVVAEDTSSKIYLVCRFRVVRLKLQVPADVAGAVRAVTGHVALLNKRVGRGRVCNGEDDRRQELGGNHREVR